MPSIAQTALFLTCALYLLTPAARAGDAIRQVDPDQAPPATQSASPPPQPAQPPAAKPNLKQIPLDGLKPGQQVSALINDQWTNATLLEKGPDSYTVSEVWPDSADEVYPYSAVMNENGHAPDPDTFKPAMAVQVFWGDRYWPARVVSVNPANITVRWEHSNGKTHKLTADQIRALPNQPIPKPGRTDKPGENQRPQIQPRPEPDKYDVI